MVHVRTHADYGCEPVSEGIQRTEKIWDVKCPQGWVEVLRSLLEKEQYWDFYSVLQNIEGQNWGDWVSGMQI